MSGAQAEIADRAFEQRGIELIPMKRQPSCRANDDEHERKPRQKARALVIQRLPAAERIKPVVATERLGQHAVEPELARIAKLLDADRHGLVPRRRLGAIGAEQPVPPRKIEAEIAVGLARQRSNGARGACLA